MDCPLGYYQPRANEQACKLCEAGQFESKPSSSSCEACSVGMYQSTEGGTRPSMNSALSNVFALAVMVSLMVEHDTMATSMK
jgi:hypothetical protein